MENIHDWINSVFLLIISIFIFLQNSIVSKMKTFTDIFDLEKVKAYNKIVEETVNLKAIHFLASETKIDEFITRTVDQTHDLAYKNYMESVGKKHIELRDFAIRVLLNLDEEEAHRIIEGCLPENKDLLLDLISSLRTKQP